MKAVTARGFKRLGQNRRELEASGKFSRFFNLCMCFLVVVVVLAVPTTLVILAPKIMLLVIGAFLLYLIIFSVGRSKVSAPTPLKCPGCQSEDLELLSCGLWDGIDEQGHCRGGSFTYATCKKCGGRCAQYIDGQPYVPTDEEWKQHFAPREKLRENQQKWPFVTEESQCKLT